jgi:heat shock protein HslJ
MRQTTVVAFLAALATYTIDADRVTLGPPRQGVVSPVLGTALTLSFRDGAVVGHSGCSTYRAGYTRDGSRLTIGPAATTRKACAGAGVMDQEQQFLAALQSATTWTIRGDVLDLHRADGARALAARRGQTE